MKILMFGIVSICMIVFFLLMSVSIETNAVRKNEVRTVLSEAMDTALSNAVKDSEVSTDSDQLTGELLQQILASTKSDSDIKIVIKKADPQMGILSVETVQSFQYPNGKKGTVAEERTAIADYQMPEEKAYHTIVYLLDKDRLYKKYRVPKEQNPSPRVPEQTGYRFQSWVPYQDDARDWGADIVFMAQFVKG